MLKKIKLTLSTTKTKCPLNVFFPHAKRLYINGILQLSVNHYVLLSDQFACFQKDYLFYQTDQHIMEVENQTAFFLP